MKNKYLKLRRKLAVLLSATMIFTSISVPTYAEEIPDVDIVEEAVEETVEDTVIGTVEEKETAEETEVVVEEETEEVSAKDVEEKDEDYSIVFDDDEEEDNVGADAINLADYYIVLSGTGLVAEDGEIPSFLEDGTEHTVNVSVHNLDDESVLDSSDYTITGTSSATVSGNYTVYVEGKDGTSTGKINAKWSIVRHTHNFVYSVNENELIAECNAEQGSIHCEYNDGSSISLSIEAGDMTYSGTAYSSDKITINKSVDGFYSLTGLSEVDKSAVKFYKGAEELAGAPVDAGTYTAKLTVAEKTIETSFVIDKASSKAFAPAKKNSAYTGGYVDLVTPKAAAGAAGVKVLYSVDEGGTWGEIVPQGMEPGDYTILYKVEGNDNYEDYPTTGSLSLTSTIGKANLSSAIIMLPQKKIAYADGASVSPEVKVYYKGVELGEGVDYDITAGASGTTVGEYTVTITACADSTKYTGTKSANWSIVELDAVWEREFTYNGAAHPIVVSLPNVDGEVVRYKALGESTYTTTPVSVTNVHEGRVYVDYMVTYTDEDGSQNLTGRAYAEVKPKSINLVKATTSYVYDGTEKSAPVVSAEAGLLKGDTVAVTINGDTAETDAGDYTIGIEDIAVTSGSSLTDAQAAQNYSFDMTEEFEWTIAKAALNVSAPTTIDATDLTYDYGLGTYSIVTAPGVVTSATGDDISETDIKVLYTLLLEGEADPLFDEVEDYTSIEATRAGEYTLKYKACGDDNHSDSAEGQISFTIKPAPLAVSTNAIGATGLEFNGTEQELLSTGAVVNDSTKGKIVYAITNSSVTVAPTAAEAWSDSMPAKKDAGSYNVWFKAKATDPSSKDSDANYITVNIGQKTLVADSVIVDGADHLTYTGANQTIVVKPDATVDSALTAEDYNISGQTQKNVGDYTVTVGGKRNYSGSITVAWHIDKANRTASAQAYDAVYDGLAHGITVNVEDYDNLPAGYEIQYSDAEAGTYTAAPIEITHVADSPKTVWYKVVDNSGNYNDTTPASSTITIRKRTLTLSAAPLEFTYEEATSQGPTITAAGCVTGESITVSANENAANINFGTYTAKVDDESCLTGSAGTQTGDYTINGAKSFEYKILKKDYTPIPAEEPMVASLTYNGAAQQLITADTVSNGTSTYAISDTKPEEAAITGDAATIEGTDAKSYTVWWKVIPTNPNYNVYCVSMNAVINKAQLQYATLPEAAADLVYTAVDKELVTAGEVDSDFAAGTPDSSIDGPQGHIEYKLGVDGEYSTAIPVAKDKGTYTVYYKLVSDNLNCEGVDEAAIADITIGKQTKANEVVNTYLTSKVVEDNIIVNLPAINPAWYMEYAEPVYDSSVPFTVSADYVNNRLILCTDGENIEETTYTITVAVKEKAGMEANYNDYVITVNVVGGICTHRAIVNHSEIPATCVEDGMKQYYECKYCGETFTSLSTKEHVDIDETFVIPANDHTPDGNSVEIVPSTCTVKGYEAQHCEVCGEVVEATEQELELLPHDFDDAVLVKAATCSENGVNVHECKVCHTQEFEDITDLAEHTYGEWEEEKPATCTTNGVKAKTCSVCAHKIYEYIDELGHDWAADYTVDVSANCVTPGSKSIHCQRCTVVKDTEVIPATEHKYKNNPSDEDFAEVDVLRAPTCTEAGYSVKHCINDGCNDAVAYRIDMLGHDFAADYTIDVSANCIREGSKSKHCSRCDEVTDITVIEKTRHRYGDFIQQRANTCLTDGVTVRTCADCGVKHYEYIAKKGHSYDLDFTVDVSANCIREGSKSRHCEHEGCLYKTDVTVIPRTEHLYGEYTVEKDVTCTTDGVKSRICSYCNHKEIEYIEHPGHDFDEYTVDVSANCVKEGIESQHCKNEGCNAVQGTRLLAKTAHQYGEFEVEEAATCTTRGVEARTCADCGKKEYKYDAALGHNFAEDYTVDVSANCVTNGSKSKHCTNAGCLEVKDVTVIPRTEHNMSDEITVLRTPSCTEKGYSMKGCTDCGYMLAFAVPELGHAYAKTPVFAWNDDYSKCDIKFICANDIRHEIVVEAKVTVMDLGAVVYYTASATIEGVEYKDTKTVAVEGVDPEEVLTLEEAKEALVDYSKVADVLEGKQSGMVSTIQAPGTVGSVSANYSEGKFLALVVHPTEKGEAVITVNAKAKVELPGSESYEMEVYDGGKLVSKPKAYASVKQSPSTGVYTLTTKANRKAVDGTYTVVLTNSQYDITVKVETIKAGVDYAGKIFNTAVQGVEGDSPADIKAALDSKDAITIELSKANTAPAEKSSLLSAVWMLDKTTLKNGEEGYGVYTKGKLTVYYRVNILQGTLTLIPARNTKGAINVTGIVNGAKYRSALKAKPMS